MNLTGKTPECLGFNTRIWLQLPPLQPLAASRWWLRWSACCHPRGRPGLCSRLLPLVQPSPRLLRTPGEETALQVPAPSTHVSDVNVPSRWPAERGAVLPQCPAHGRICQRVVTAVHTGLALTHCVPRTDSEAGRAYTASSPLHSRCLAHREGNHVDTNLILKRVQPQTQEPASQPAWFPHTIVILMKSQVHSLRDPLTGKAPLLSGLVCTGCLETSHLSTASPRTGPTCQPIERRL